MGSSFTEFRGFGFWSRDGQIEVWLYLLVQEIDQLTNLPAWLQDIRDYWHHQATAGYIGCVSAGLDRLLTNDEKIEVILGLSLQALAWIDEQGPTISQDILNAMGTGGRGAVFLMDVNTEVFAKAGKAFVALLRGERDEGLEIIKCV